MSPRLIPTHEVRKTLYARARASVLSLLFAYGQSSRGVATPIRDTPRDVLSIRKSNEVYYLDTNLLLVCRFCFARVSRITPNLTVADDAVRAQATKLPQCQNQRLAPVELARKQDRQNTYSDYTTKSESRA